MIKKSIQSYYKNRIFAPIIYLIFLVVISFFYPMKPLMAPATYSTDKISLGEMYADKEQYAKFELKDLYFTGYTSKWLDATRGYYYYTMIGQECVVVLVNPTHCDQGAPYIGSISLKGKINYDSSAVRSLLTRLALDLSWSEEGIVTTVSSFSISEPDATNPSTMFFIFVYVATGLFAFFSLLAYGLFIIHPVACPAVRQLGAYGKPSEILDEAEEELATLPQLAAEDMFITEHYFIETSNYGVAIVPIDAIIWIYKYSTMHKLLWHHFAITYTLYITAGKRHYIKCPKNTKTDIDGIIDYLSEANHDILVGFSEENRLKVEEIQNDFDFAKRVYDVMNKRV